MSEFQSSYLYGGERLCSKSELVGSDTGFDVTCFTAGFGMSVFMNSFALVAVHSTSIAFPVLHWINSAIDDMK